MHFYDLLVPLENRVSQSSEKPLTKKSEILETDPHLLKIHMTIQNHFDLAVLDETDSL